MKLPTNLVAVAVAIACLGASGPAIATQPGMTGLESNSPSSQVLRMNDDMMVPPEVMMLKAGKSMVGYQFMFDEMNGNLVGTSHVSNTTILGSFAAAPTDMTMQMHMGVVMYAPTDRLTLMAMPTYIVKTMNHVTGAGTRFTEQASGIGDLELRGLYSLYATEDHRHRFLLN